MSQTIPQDRGGRIFRRVLVVVAIGTIIGIADATRAIGWNLLSHIAGNSEPVSAYAHELLKLAGWATLGWIAWRGLRYNLAPQGWALLAVPLLVWAYILLPG